jgi:hypothetical protein
MEGMYTTKEREPQSADVAFRLKGNGAGLHYGRLVQTVNVVPSELIGGGYFSKLIVANTTPSQGKHLDSPANFLQGLPGGWIPQDFTEPERRVVEQLSVSDLGRPYGLLATCEDDVFGFSPTRNKILGGLVALGLLFAAGAAFTN